MYYMSFFCLEGQNLISGIFKKKTTLYVTCIFTIFFPKRIYISKRDLTTKLVERWFFLLRQSIHDLSLDRCAKS